MPKCPACQAEIKELYSIERAYLTYSYDGEDYSLEPIETDIDWDFSPAFICPSCLATIAENEEDARAFFSKEVKPNA